MWERSRWRSSSRFPIASDRPTCGTERASEIVLSALDSLAEADRALIKVDDLLTHIKMRWGEP